MDSGQTTCETGKAYELSDDQAQDIERAERATATVSTVFVKSSQSGSGVCSKQHMSMSKCLWCNRIHSTETKCPVSKWKCNNCGQLNHFAGAQRCPAKGKHCNSCSKTGQFSAKCMSSETSKGHRPMRCGDKVCASDDMSRQQSADDYVVDKDTDCNYGWTVNQSSGHDSRPVFTASKE